MPVTASQRPSVPEFRWPEEQHLAPRQCGDCGSRMLEDDAPHGLVKVGERRCVMCARVLNLWRAGWGNRASAAVDPRSEDATSICLDCGNLTGQRVCALGRKRLRCPSCALEFDRRLAREKSRERYWGVR